MADKFQTHPKPDNLSNKPLWDILLGSVAIGLGTISIILQQNGLLPEAQNLRGMLTDPSWQLFAVAAFSFTVGVVKDIKRRKN
ncbi:hypothetical protein A2767_04110 [Candidatus Roizmanbacteria bacterium RIFCSPHIGHO2_01_FULL_35_10]|uniref:Uncharacterized protein n=1 Tax=Candidatus Roizmanbacteria bacterium RIFCSPLOWO2_01_FULL_35_13 TaxID=1802055 RepID=A0A1F7IH74_9BACT|nr:MAG: hypothetical protein A2767_04110 [Candidatus Roizmanbacteria bacterium RIFCSPHIGHO2_01_FULL_35_10]OGK42675.1 MAG: hypothetical protein A3A74_00005 [Candidatus Roizmanbacteria bacterium RIFCSPLOWO2_01_FULL_35_13]